MKMNEKEKRFRFPRFNVVLFLVCLVLAFLIWATSLYINDPYGVRPEESAAAPAVTSEVLL